MNNNDMDELKGEYLAALEAELREGLKYPTERIDAAKQMLHYHMGWDAQNQPSGAPGKRTRPLLTLLCANAAGGQWRAALPLAAAVELVHNFSLIHDDIQDESELRRGRATLWVLWGKPQAINAGDAMFAHAHLAVQYATALSPETRLEALNVLDQACLALTAGQYFDLAFESTESVDEKAYKEMVAGKTAALIAVAAELGALAAGASAAQREKYRSFGHALGLAYQVRDDILGIWGESDRTGKPFGADILARKKTLPVVIGMERSTELRALYHSPVVDDTDVCNAVRLLQECGARAAAEDVEREQVNLALSRLAAAGPVDKGGEVLQSLAQQLLERTN
ncbi:MAG: polyprenyl synthetase family protein [Anaerolineales bacterium]|jgi:geranylgeranyl diphosphate synthase type I|nr:polyprenyl synthetase family protein [Anaerolineales bacterium]